MGLAIPKKEYWLESFNKKKAKKAAAKAFHDGVLKADHFTCQAHDCPFKGWPKEDQPVIDPHHIIPKGRGGDSKIDNGMSLHRSPCHSRAQNGFWRGDDFISGDDYALEIITHWEKLGKSRWDRVKEILMRKQP